MTNTDNATRTALLAAIARREADRPANSFIMPDRPADRSRNGRRIPRSVSHRGLR
jgi:hypothetical protein